MKKMRIRNRNTCEPFFYALDIETSTVNDKTGVPVCTWMAYGFLNKYDLKGQRIEKNMFRTWGDLREMLHKIEITCANKVQMWVHFLSFESDWLFKNISRPDGEKLLSNKSHNVIRTILSEFPHIELRCSYMLSGMSLRKLGDLVGLPKLDDDYAVYFPEDEIPQESAEYCCRDVDIVARYVAEMLKEYKKLQNIPFTKTGRVRKVFEKFYDKTESNATTWDLMPDEHVYEMQKKALRGGITISNPEFTGMTLHGVSSFDECCAYPFVMIRQTPGFMFPRHWVREYDIGHPDIALRVFPHFIATMKFTGLKSRYAWNWLSLSSCEETECTVAQFNGKVIEADEIITTLTDVDYKTMEMTYTWDDVEIVDMIVSFEDMPLPECYILAVETLAKKKDMLKRELKEVAKKHGESSEQHREKSFEYQMAKSDFNSIFGMSIMTLHRPEFEIDDSGLWSILEGEYKQENKHMKRNFGFGVYITAFARYNLVRAIVRNCPKSFVYADTDSIKKIDDGVEFIDTNERLEQYVHEPSLYALGQFEVDGHYDSFRTLGAKKYAYTTDGSDVVHLTVAGLPKVKRESDGSEHIVTLKHIDDFKPKTEFRDVKNGHVYINNTITDKVFGTINGTNPVELDTDALLREQFMRVHKINDHGGVAISSCDYTLDITDNDALFIFNLYGRLVDGVDRKELRDYQKKLIRRK